MLRQGTISTLIQKTCQEPVSDFARLCLPYCAVYDTRKHAYQTLATHKNSNYYFLALQATVPSLCARLENRQAQVLGFGIDTHLSLNSCLR